MVRIVLFSIQLLLYFQFYTFEEREVHHFLINRKINTVQVHKVYISNISGFMYGKRERGGGRKGERKKQKERKGVAISQRYIKLNTAKILN